MVFSEGIGVWERSGSGDTFSRGFEREKWVFWRGEVGEEGWYFGGAGVRFSGF